MYEHYKLCCDMISWIFNTTDDSYVLKFDGIYFECYKDAGEHINIYVTQDPKDMVRHLAMVINKYLSETDN